MANDAQLLRRFLEGAQDAFAELVRRHLALVYASALRRAAGDTALAREATQAVFLLLAKKAPHLCHRASVAGWLYSSAQLKVAEALRAERRRRVREHTAYLMHQMLTDGTSADWEQIHPVLDQAMLGLDGADREAVLLRYFEGLPFDDIAGRLLLTESAARKRVERALEKLRQSLARKGVSSSAAALAAVLGTQTGFAAPAGLAGTVTSAAAATFVPGPSPWLVSIVTLMTTTQKTTTVAVLVALLGAGSAWYQHRAARDLAWEKSDLQHQLASLRSDPPAKREALVVRLTPDASVTTSSAASSSAAPAQSLATAIEAEQMRLFFATEWARLAEGALPLVEKLGLSADQVARYTAMAERELQGTYLPGPMAVNRYQTELREKWRNETREILGDEAFQHLQRLQAAKGEVERIAGYLAYWDHALTGQQANQMLQVVAASEALVKATAGTLPESLVAQAGQILTPSQISLWRRLHGLADTQRQLTESLRAKDAAAASKSAGG